VSRVTGAPKPLTRAQRDVVLADDPRLLVGAGAGSGKTSTVVQKLCYLLGGRVSDDDGVAHLHPAPLTLDQIAAITFTNEAAADLKRKLRSALTSAGLRHLATEVDAARIGTIHGFCGDLLREFALRAGLPPSLTVLEEGEAGALSTESARLSVQRAVVDGHVPALGELLRDRKLGDVIALVAKVASESDRLDSWTRNRHRLRPHEQALLTLARDARALRTTALADDGSMDFDRMIVAVRDLLRDDTQVRHAVQRQLRLLIIDEFQDVDPAQRDLAYLLGGLHIADDPSPTQLLLVGDPKQSIYRFRRADVALWNAVAATFASSAGGRVLELSDNFRSRQGILTFVDRTIGRRLDTPVDEERGRQQYEVDYRPLSARGPDHDGDRCVEVLAISAGSDGKARGATDVRDLEAQAIASRILEMHAEGIPFGDIALLFGALTDLKTYRDALRAAGIPLYVLRSDGFWEAREVLDCLLALRAIRDPADEVALTGFLRSPFVGVRDDTLLSLVAAGHHGGLYGALCDVAFTRLEPARCARAAAMLAHFGALRDRLPVHMLLERLATESGFLASLALGGDDRAQALANLRKLLREAAAHPELSLGEFLRDVREIRDRGDRVGDERLYRERADVVTITTIHSAKGLEWPVVFWCDVVRAPKASTDALQCGRTEFRLKQEDETGEDELQSALRVEQALEDSAEQSRRWYVAATRARRMLVVSGVPCGSALKKSDSVAQAMRGWFPELIDCVASTTLAYADAAGTAFELVVRHIAPVASITAAHRTAGDFEVATVPADWRPPVVVSARNGRRRLSATQLMAFDRDAGAWWRRYAFGFEPDAIGLPRRDRDSAIVVGTLVHAVLERYNFELEDIDELVASVVERHAAEDDAVDEDRARSYRREVHALVQQAVGSPTWESLARVASARRELAFTRLFPDGTSIEGAFDLVAMQDGAARILDAKTGATKSDELLADRYRIQGAVYEDAVRSIAGTASSFALLSVADNRVIEVDSSGVSVANLVHQLRNGAST